MSRHPPVLEIPALSWAVDSSLSELWQVLVTRKRGSRASSAAPSGDASFSSGKSFIAAQHAEEARPFAEGPLNREDRSMTHEGILLHESPQVNTLSTHMLEEMAWMCPLASPITVDCSATCALMPSLTSAGTPLSYCLF